MDKIIYIYIHVIIDTRDTTHSSKEYNFVKVVGYNNENILLLLSPPASPDLEDPEPPVVVLKMPIKVLQKHAWVSIKEANNMLDIRYIDR